MSTWIWISIVALALLTVLVGLQKFKSTTDWLPINGRVISSSIEEIKNTNSQQTSQGTSRYDYKVNIKYEYTVESKNYTGEAITAVLPNIFDLEADAKKILSTYPTDKETNIFFNPKNPSESALITAKSIPTIFFIFIFVFIGLIGGGIIFILKSGILD